MVLLKTFGGLSLVGPAVPAPARQRRRLALLVLLARAGELGISRDRLLAYLWPESSDENARHALDQLLYITRRDLGRSAVRMESLQLLLDPNVVRSDCAEFETLLAQGDLAGAVEVYAGPFLDGVHLGGSVELERWVDGERALLAQKLHAAVEEVAAEVRASGDLEGAVSWWRRRAAEEPMNGRVARSLMEALVESGDRAGALRHAGLYSALVEEELESEPDPVVTAFVEELRASSAASPRDFAAHPRRDAAVPVAVEASREAVGSSSRVPGGAPAVSSRRRRLGIAAAILAVLLAAVLPELRPRGSAARPGEAIYTPVGVRTPDPEARDIYLKARLAWDRRSAEGLEEAVVLFRRATERDPAYAEAWAGLANAYVLLGYLGYLPGTAAFPKGRGAALQALALSPTLGEAHAALGKALQWEGRWEEAEEAFTRAVAYAPEYATGHQWYALLLRILGRPEEAVEHATLAAQLEPLSIQVHNTLGMMLYSWGRADSALAVFERVVTNEPDTAWVRENPWVLANFGKVAAAAGRFGEAMPLAERAAEAVPGHPRILHTLAFVHLAAGDTARARSTFDRADPTHPHHAAYQSLMYADLGDLDAAFLGFGRVEEWSLALLGVISGDPSLAALRADPRYRDLRRRLRLPAIEP